MLHFIMVQKLRNKDFLQFMTEILAVISRSDPSQILVSTKYNDLFLAKANLADFVKNNKIHPITDELIDLAKTRDLLFHYIFRMLDANTCHFDCALENHAYHLLAPLLRYDIEYEPEKYEIEYPLVNDMLHYWTANPDRIIGLKELNLLNDKNHLADANAAFNTKYLGTTLQPKLFAAYTLLKEKRLPVSNAYYLLHRRLNAQADVHEEREPFGSVVNELNVIIDKYNVLVNTHHPPAA